MNLRGKTFVDWFRRPFLFVGHVLVSGGRADQAAPTAGFDSLRGEGLGHLVQKSGEPLVGDVLPGDALL